MESKVSGEEEQMLEALGYRIRNFLGSGQFARVYLVKRKEKGQPVKSAGIRNFWKGKHRI